MKVYKFLLGRQELQALAKIGKGQIEVLSRIAGASGSKRNYPAGVPAAVSGGINAPLSCRVTLPGTLDILGNTNPSLP